MKARRILRKHGVPYSVESVSVTAAPPATASTRFIGAVQELVKNTLRTDATAAGEEKPVEAR